MLLTALTFTLLALSIVGLWLSPYVWMPFLSAAVVAGYCAGVLHDFAAVFIVMLAASVWLYRRARAAMRVAGGMGFVVLSLLLGLHVLPGFSNPQILDDAVLVAGAAAYDLYLNFDKTLPGILFLGLAYEGLIRTRVELRQALCAAWPVMLATIVAIIGASLASGYVQFEPHWTPYIWVWSFSNLLLTCLAEEAFFRGFLLERLQILFHKCTHATLLALLTSSLLFGLVHVGGGWGYVGLATLAGIGYGYARQRSGRIEMAMLTHFSVNFLHFVLFTYPYAI